MSGALLSGYFSLGGGTEIKFDQFDTVTKPPIGKNRGAWGACVQMGAPFSMSIPSRDKVIEYWTQWDRPVFEKELSDLDSWQGRGYKAKLRWMLYTRLSQYPDLVALIANHNTSTHSSFALLTNDRPIYVVGLYDQQRDGSYVVWSDDPATINEITYHQPLRFLLYRFQPLVKNVLFFQPERLCSNWWRWLKQKQGPLLAFNALERQLYSDNDPEPTT
jgi:hypothetical protein